MTFLTKFNGRFSNLFEIKCAKFYSDDFKFDIFILHFYV